MARIERDASNADFILYRVGSKKVFLLKDDYGTVEFDGWDDLEITEGYDLLLLIQMLNYVNLEKQGVNMEGKL